MTNAAGLMPQNCGTCITEVSNKRLNAILCVIFIFPLKLLCYNECTSEESYKMNCVLFLEENLNE